MEAMSMSNSLTEDNTIKTSPIETDTTGTAETQAMPTQGNMPSPSGIYVQVPRDVPAQPASPQSPFGPSKATIVLSLLPLFFWGWWF
jgi:hypothetical protein